MPVRNPLAAAMALAAVVVWAGAGVVADGTGPAALPAAPPVVANVPGMASVVPGTAGPASAAAPVGFLVALRDFEWRLVSGDEHERELALDLQLPALLAQDPDSLRRSVARMPAGLLHDRLRAAVIARWVALDGAAAVGWVQALADEDERAEAGRELVAALARSDPARALEAAERLRMGLADGTLERTARVWAQADAAAALNWAAQRLSEPAGASSALVWPIVQAAAAQMPAQASGWALLLPDGQARLDAVQMVSRAWTAQDPDAAAAWIDAMQPGEIKDLSLAAARAARAAQ